MFKRLGHMLWTLATLGLTVLECCWYLFVVAVVGFFILLMWSRITMHPQHHLPAPRSDASHRLL